MRFHRICSIELFHNTSSIDKHITRFPSKLIKAYPIGEVF